MKFKPIIFSPEYQKKYWHGPQNFIVRMYVYLQRGFALVNEAKNYFLIVFGSIWTVKCIDILRLRISTNLISLDGLVGLPILGVVGRC